MCRERRQRTFDLGCAGVSHARVVNVSDLRLLGGREGERVARGHRQARGGSAGRVLSRHRGHQSVEERLREVEECPLVRIGRLVGQGTGEEFGTPAFSEGRAARFVSSGEVRTEVGLWIRQTATRLWKPIRRPRCMRTNRVT